MRVLSVVFVVATLAIFGVMANKKKCDIECPPPETEELRTCNYYRNIKLSLSQCESRKLIACALKMEGQHVMAYNGSCATPSMSKCEVVCKRTDAPVWGRIDGVDEHFSSLCIFGNRANCRVAELNGAKIQLLSYGDAE